MVAMNVWPTDAADGAVTSEARWRKMGRLWAPSGATGGVGGELKPSYLYPTLTVKNGAAWADGHYCELTADQGFGGMTALSVGLVVVRFDPTANTAELLYLDGATTPSQNPAGVWEVPIARLNTGVMTDLRTLVAPAAVTPWTPVTALLNSWSTSAPVSRSSSSARSATSSRCGGVMKSGTLGQPAFNLPAGFRPLTNLAFAVSSAGAFGNLAISAAGDVTPANGSAVSFHVTGATFSVSACTGAPHRPHRPSAVTTASFHPQAGQAWRSISGFDSVSITVER